MGRFAIDKRMDVSTYRHLLGANQMQLADMTPHPGQVLDTLTVLPNGNSNPAPVAAPPPPMIISSEITGHKPLDPKSVRMTLISVARTSPLPYEPGAGSTSR